MKKRTSVLLAVVSCAAILTGLSGSGCTSSGSGYGRVHYGIGVGTWWPHRHHWDRGPIYVGPPIEPDYPEPELPIEPPPEFIAMPYFE